MGVATSTLVWLAIHHIFLDVEVHELQVLAVLLCVLVHRDEGVSYEATELPPQLL